MSGPMRSPRRCAPLSGRRARRRATPSLATEAAKRHFPPAELALIAELVRRDAPFYDPEISADTVHALNAFAKDMGLLSQPAFYEQVVATRFKHLWTR